MTEAILLKQSKQLLRVLAGHGLLAWRRLHVMPVISHAGKRTIFRKNLDMQGMPDLVVLLKSVSALEPVAHGTAHTLWIELKAQRGRQTPAQRACEQEWQGLGHHYRVIRKIEELEQWLLDFAITHPLLDRKPKWK